MEIVNYRVDIRIRFSREMRESQSNPELSTIADETYTLRTDSIIETAKLLEPIYQVISSDQRIS
jgi:hypothetical protein